MGKRIYKIMLYHIRQNWNLKLGGTSYKMTISHTELLLLII